MIDSHCHPQFPQYDADREEVIKRTLAVGCGMICVGTDLEMSKKAIELAEKYDGIWATAGCHPNETNQELRIEDYEELAKHPKVVAIGETGLDYYRIKNQELRIKQRDIFRQFLELAVRTKKPVAIHCRNAYEDMLDILKNNPVVGIIHSFTGNFELAQKFLDLGLYLGLNGIITFPPSRKATEGQAPTDLGETVTNIPLDRILIETDAPYLAPVPHRGKRNEPLWVEFVARRIAEIKKVSFEEVAEKTSENIKKLFKLE
jgi:TatD DNase family protein